MKKTVKHIFSTLGATNVLDVLLFNFAKLKGYSSNSVFKNQNSNFLLPPDYFLYETYQLNYKQYKEDGEASAKEIIEWAKPYCINLTSILEWGCGVARIVRHMPSIVSNADVYGVDINTKMIEWNCANIPNVNFKRIDYSPPTLFEDNTFNLIYAISVFTHIEAEAQIDWIKEIHRITYSKGIFMFSTHGRKYETKLSAHEHHLLQTKGVYTIAYKEKGHRMMSTYNTEAYFKKLLKPYFEIMEFYDGEKFPDKVGGQDFWIGRKI